MHLAFDPGDNKKEGKEVEAWVWDLDKAPVSDEEPQAEAVVREAP